MKRNKYKDYLWYTALAVSVICVIEGIMYYHNIENLFLRVSLNIQNVIKAYKIDPDIKQAEALAFLQTSGGGFVQGIITYLYCVAVIVAPFCTISALAILVQKPASYVRGWFYQRSKKKILLIGSGKYQSGFLNALCKDCRITLIDKNDISEEKKLQYLNKGITFIQKYPDMSEKDTINLIHISDYKDIILCDDNVIDNIEYLKVLSEMCENIKDSFQQVYLCCADNAMSELIKQYYDGLKTKTFDLNIVDVNKMAVNKMLKEHPVYMANENGDYNVHMGILGFGEFGQSTLIQALNMAVLSADSKICMDVFDKDIHNIMGIFMKNFSVEVLKGLKCYTEDVFEGEKVQYYELNFSGAELNEKFEMDGEIQLRFWKSDVCTLQFSHIFNRCQKEMSFSYLVVAMGDMCSTAGTITELKQLLYQKGDTEVKIPLIVRMENNNDFIKIYNEKNLFVVEQEKNIFSYASLTDSSLMEMAKQFNYRYNMLYDFIYSYRKENQILDDTFMSGLEKAFMEGQSKIENEKAELNNFWHKMSIFDRESSIAQALHQEVKKWLIYDRKAYSFTNDKEKLEKLEHRRWTVFMITHGFKYEKAERKDLYAKTHPCILNWDNLKVERPDTLEYDFTPYYILKMEEKHV